MAEEDMAGAEELVRVDSDIMFMHAQVCMIECVLYRICFL